MFREWRKNFLTGCLAFLPLVVTIGFLWLVFKKIDNLLITQIINFLPEAWIESTPARFFWKLIALVIVIGLVTFIGIITRNVLGKKLLQIAEFMVSKIPFINKIYISVKEIRDTFVGGKKKFNHLVLVEYPSKGIYTLGFVTNPAPPEIKEKLTEPMVSVFLPTSPNPTNGWLIYVAERELISLKMSVEEGMKLIISGGAIKI